MEKISLSQALDDTGLKKKHIAKQLGITTQYYSTFVKRRTINQAQATIIELLTKLDIADIDIEIR